MKGTRQSIGLCLVFGMLIVGNPSIVAQGTIKKSPPAIQNAEIRALSIGDKVPDIEFQNVLNYKSRTAKLSDFAGKLVILDMWSIYCTSCIKGFPKMEELQKKFPNQIQILLVNPHDPQYDSEEKIKSTLDKLKTRTGYYPSLPIPIHDSILNLYFPHQSVPHQIWINSSGNVVAITGSQDLTQERIQAFLKGKEIKIPVKNDWAFDDKKPLLVDGNGGSAGDFNFRSLFTGYKGELGFSAGMRVSEDHQVIGIFKLNKLLVKYVSEAYSDIMNGLNSNRIFFDATNPEKFKWNFEPQNAYCYDLTIPATSFSPVNVQEYLREDLKRFFNISAFKEKRKIKCLVLTATKKLNKILTKYEKQELETDSEIIKKYFHNYTLDEVVHMLDWFDLPMINETKLKERIDIEFPDHFDIKNKNAVIQHLKNLGFTITEEERELDVVVVTDK